MYGGVRRFFRLRRGEGLDGGIGRIVRVTVRGLDCELEGMGWGGLDYNKICHMRDGRATVG